MKVFITGVSGYVGGSVAVRLLKAGHQVRGLVRNAQQIEPLKGLGIDPVLGSLDDAELLIKEARAADAVVNAANSDHRPAVAFFIEALRGTGKALLHTSGISLLGDAAAGNSVNEQVFDERQPLIIAPEKQARFAIDCMVQEAEGLRGIVLCNSLIYGKGKGLQPNSVQIPALVEQARSSGAVSILGRGFNRWSTVHIEDVCALYLLALEQTQANGLYFVENGESSFQEIAEALALRLGLTASSIEHWTEEQAIKHWGFNRARFSLGSNSRVSSQKARQVLGWQPKHASLITWITNEMEI